MPCALKAMCMLFMGVARCPVRTKRGPGCFFVNPSLFNPVARLIGRGERYRCTKSRNTRSRTPASIACGNLSGTSRTQASRERADVPGARMSRFGFRTMCSSMPTMRGSTSRRRAHGGLQLSADISGNRDVSLLLVVWRQEVGGARLWPLGQRVQISGRFFVSRPIT